MKPWQIAIFIFLTITCLGIISFFYPDDGLRLAGHDIRFRVDAGLHATVVDVVKL